MNDTETYDNGVKVVPSYLLEPVSVDITNYKSVLIGSGYYTEEDLRLNEQSNVRLSLSGGNSRHGLI